MNESETKIDDTSESIGMKYDRRQSYGPHNCRETRWKRC